MPTFLRPDKREKEQEGHCSWCFQSSKHDILRDGGLVHRSKYQCQNCLRETIKCRKPVCNEFARVVPGFQEERCYYHRGFIKDWNDKEGIAELQPIGYCSSCFEIVKQKVVIINPITGSRMFECFNCKCATCKCKECNDAFAFNDVEVCARCQGSIKDWDDVQNNKENIFLTKICSWCLEESKHMCRNLKQEQYQCMTCSGETKPCNNCDCMMAKKECAKCTISEKDGVAAWDGLLARKKANDEKYQDWGELMEDLHRPSDYFNKARNAGVIRPYLILILMQPHVRVYVGMALGIVLSKQDDYLDPHAEAWYLLSHSSRGLIARSTTRNEKLNYFGKSVDWYVCLHRLMTMYTVQRRWVEIPEDTLTTSISVGNKDMVQLELVLMQDIIDRQVKNLSDVARANLKMIREHNEPYEYFKQLIQDTKYYQSGKETYVDMQLLQAFQQFGLHLREEVMSMEEAISTNIMIKYAGLDIKSCGDGSHDSEFNKTGYFVTGKIASKVPVIAMKNAVASVIPVVGWAVIGYNVSGALLRETIDVCAVPVREIFLHYTLLIARGVEIEEFYHIHEDFEGKG